MRYKHVQDRNIEAVSLDELEMKFVLLWMVLKEGLENDTFFCL